MANQNLSTRLNAGAAAVVIPGTSDGLVSKNGVPGNTTGSAIAASYVGQVVTGATTGSGTMTNGTVYNRATISVPAGIWIIYAKAFFQTPSTPSGGAMAVDAAISSVSATLPSQNTTRQVLVTGGDQHVNVLPVNVALSATTTYYLCGAAYYTAGTVTLSSDSGGTQFYAVRIA